MWAASACVCVGVHVCICKWGMKLAFYLQCFMGDLLVRSLSFCLACVRSVCVCVVVCEYVCVRAYICT